MSTFYKKSKEWRLCFGNSLGVEHSEMLRRMVEDKRVLDVGDKDSPFLARTFAPLARSWTMVGRPPPLDISLAANFRGIANPFSPVFAAIQAESVDLVLLSFPSPSLTQDANAVQWATRDHLIIFLGNSQEENQHGSPAFWQLTGSLDLQMDAHDKVSRLMVWRKKAPPRVSRIRPASPSKIRRVSKIRLIERRIIRKPVKPRNLPRKGDRYRLTPSAYWPNKKAGIRAPAVEMVCDWSHPFGAVRVIQTGEVFHIRLADLGGRIFSGRPDMD